MEVLHESEILPCEILRFEKTQKRKRKFSLYKVSRGKKTENKKSDVCGKKIPQRYLDMYRALLTTLPEG